jgi:hypothetical protein
MSKKRMMSRAQRIYYEQCKKERIQKELAEYAKNMKEYEDKMTQSRGIYRLLL